MNSYSRKNPFKHPTKSPMHDKRGCDPSNFHAYMHQKENQNPNVKLRTESNNMFNYVISDSGESNNADAFIRALHKRECVDISRDTLNPRNFNEVSDYLLKDDTLIIPNFSNGDIKDKIFSNVCNFAALPEHRRSSESQIELNNEEHQYTEDVLGVAKNLIFSDLSLASWSNKDVSISSRSELIGYATNENKEKEEPVFTPEKEAGIGKSPILNFDTRNIFKPTVDDKEFSEQLSQDSILFSPMNLKHYQLPIDEVEEMKNSKILYESKIYSKVNSGKDKGIVNLKTKQQTEEQDDEESTPKDFRKYKGNLSKS